MKIPPVLGIAGWSGCGKTTLLTYLVMHLSEQGMRVNVVKHSHHLPGPEVPGKDSARLRAAGAGKVLVSSSRPPWSVPDIGFRTEPTLNEILEKLPPADVVLLEGFKKAAICKLEVHRSVVRMPVLYPNDPNVIAVASDSAPHANPSRRIWLDINKPAQILAWLHIFIDCQSSNRRYGYTVKAFPTHESY